MEVFHRGDVLAAAVRDLLSQLPSGRLVLLATTTAGAGVAAASAAQRNEPTTWIPVDFRLPAAGIEGRAVVVDPVDAGAGWRDALLRRYPDAEFVTAKPGSAPLELVA